MYTRGVPQYARVRMADATPQAPAPAPPVKRPLLKRKTPAVDGKSASADSAAKRRKTGEGTPASEPVHASVSVNEVVELSAPIPTPQPVLPSTPEPSPALPPTLPPTPALPPTPTPSPAATTVIDILDDQAGTSVPEARETGWFSGTDPTGSLCESYATPLLLCMSTGRPEDLSKEQIGVFMEEKDGMPLFVLQKRARMQPPHPSLQSSFPFTWYPQHRAHPKTLERISVITSTWSVGVHFRAERVRSTGQLDAYNTANMRPMMEAWWRTFITFRAQASKLVEPLAVILREESTGHFTVLISHDGVLFQHHNSLPMGEPMYGVVDPSDVLARKWVLNAYTVITHILRSDPTTREYLRNLRLPGDAAKLLEDRNAKLLDRILDSSVFSITSHLDRKRLGNFTLNVKHESLIQPPGSNECLLHCIERIAYCIASGGNSVGMTDGPTTQQRRETIARMRRLCIKWHDMFQPPVGAPQMRM